MTAFESSVWGDGFGSRKEEGSGFWVGLPFEEPLITLKGLIFAGFWAQRPYYVRLLGYFDAKGNNGLASQ